MDGQDNRQIIVEKIKLMLSYPFRKGWPGVVITVLILLFIIGAGLSSLVDSSKPGDTMFFMDRAFEKLRIATSLSDTSRFKHKVAIAEERLDELQEIKSDDTKKLLGSLDELQKALIDMQSDISNVDDLAGAQDSANKLATNLLDLVANYKSFLLGDTVGTEDIQKELDNSIDKINDIVNVVQENNPTSNAQPVQSPNVAPATPPASNDDESEGGGESDDHKSCSTTYQKIGGQVEQEGVTLQKNSCGEYTVTYGGTTHVLITGNNLDYAVGQKVKFHGESGTNNSIYLTEFELVK